MPELPEVETVRRYLQACLPGQQIAEVTLYRADLRYPMPVKELQQLPGQTLAEVQRRAKYLLLATTGGPTLLVHLGMSGRVFVEPMGPGEPPERRKHEHWRMRLAGPRGGQWLRYVDARRFGSLDVTAEPLQHPLLSGLGPEPLESGFDARLLLDACAGRQVAVKQLLMDPAVVVGIGNIYASETCYRAKVSPLRPANSLTLQDCAALVRESRAVLEEAIAAGGSTLRDFASGDEKPGYFQQRLDVYDRKGEPCHRCQRNGEAPAISRAVLGQRATYWCPNCQV